jgi:hypothetical protein
MLRSSLFQMIPYTTELGGFVVRAEREVIRHDSTDEQPTRRQGNEKEEERSVEINNSKCNSSRCCRSQYNNEAGIPNLAMCVMMKDDEIPMRTCHECHCITR